MPRSKSTPGSKTTRPKVGKAQPSAANEASSELSSAVDAPSSTVEEVKASSPDTPAFRSETKAEPAAPVTDDRQHTEHASAGNGLSEHGSNGESRKFEVVKNEVAKSDSRNTDSRNNDGRNNNVVPINLEDEIRRRAYEIYEQRGAVSGNEADDWLTAEREVRQRYRAQSA